jgi:DNA-directed RNA polymerase specialized sigma24 family protein
MGVSSPVPETQQPYPRVVKAVDQLPDAERLVVLLVLLDQFPVQRLQRFWVSLSPT